VLVVKRGPWLARDLLAVRAFARVRI